jgi:hypothetical protein
VFLVAVLIAGCTQSAPREQANEALFDDGTGPIHAPVTLLDGAALWHADGRPAMLAFDIVLHAMARVQRECTIDGRPGFWGVVWIPDIDPVPRGTTALSITLDWSNRVYMEDELVVAYQMPGSDWIHGPYQQRGAPMLVNVTAGGWDRWSDHSDWSFAMCNSTNADADPASPGFRPDSPRGLVDVQIVALPAAAS